MVALESISQPAKHPWNLTDDVILVRSRILPPLPPTSPQVLPTLSPSLSALELRGQEREKGLIASCEQRPTGDEFSRPGSRKSLNLDCASEMTLVPPENFVSLAEHCLKAPKKGGTSVQARMHGDRERKVIRERAK